ncbi:MAG: 2-oxoacid:acceptor oxidoreductase family protein [Patescibacteria group bacterium]|jgi:pyruvate ferredoxin oxidoreductase gamma subunit|nr:2-oxoacid:acceptor oxidoreductase family protein [Patescibacteria group bacterium]
MFEVRIHGRAGQGAKLAAQLLAETALTEGKFIQAFPEYGPERSGAPVVSNVRIDKKEIRKHYPVVQPDVVVILDPNLIEVVDINQGVGPETLVIINTDQTIIEIKKQYQIKGQVKTLPATGIALETIKTNKPNTVLLAYLIQLTKVVKINSFKKIVQQEFKHKGKEEFIQSNLTAIEKGYNFKK